MIARFVDVDGGSKIQFPYTIEQPDTQPALRPAKSQVHDHVQVGRRQLVLLHVGIRKKRSLGKMKSRGDLCHNVSTIALFEQMQGRIDPRGESRGREKRSGIDITLSTLPVN